MPTTSVPKSSGAMMTRIRRRKMVPRNCRFAANDGKSWPTSTPANRPTRIQEVRERRLAAMAAISAMTSQRKMVGTNGGRGSSPLLDNSEKAIASVATTIAAARTLFFIRAKRYAGWMRVSMVADREKPSEMKTGGGGDQTFHPGGKPVFGAVLPPGSQ